MNVLTVFPCRAFAVSDVPEGFLVLGDDPSPRGISHYKIALLVDSVHFERTFYYVALPMLSSDRTEIVYLSDEKWLVDLINELETIKKTTTPEERWFRAREILVTTFAFFPIVAKDDASAGSAIDLDVDENLIGRLSIANRTNTSASFVTKHYRRLMQVLILRLSGERVKYDFPDAIIDRFANL